MVRDFVDLGIPVLEKKGEEQDYRIVDGANCLQDVDEAQNSNRTPAKSILLKN